MTPLKFGDQVVIVSDGFYAGVKGTVIDTRETHVSSTHNKSGHTLIEYLVSISTWGKNVDRWVLSSHLAKPVEPQY